MRPVLAARVRGNDFNISTSHAVQSFVQPDEIIPLELPVLQPLDEVPWQVLFNLTASRRRRHRNRRNRIDIPSKSHTAIQNRRQAVVGRRCHHRRKCSRAAIQTGNADACSRFRGQKSPATVALPGYVLAVEALFGLPHERLAIRHDAGKSAVAYVLGTPLAVRTVRGTTGLIRGLDRLLFDA